MNILLHSQDKVSMCVLASRLSIHAPKSVSFSPVDDERIESLESSDPREQNVILLAGNGLDRLAADIRAKKVRLPMIAAPASFSPESVISLLEAGCDDVVKATVDACEVAARFRAISRRASGMTTNVLKIGELVIRLDGSDPEYEGRRIRLSKIESAILDTLARRPGHPVSRESIFACVWPDSDKQPYDKVLDVHMHNLRKKLAAASGGERYIETVPSRGFFLERRRRQNQIPTVEDPSPETVPVSH